MGQQPRYRGRGIEIFKVGERCAVPNRYRTDQEGVIVAVEGGYVTIRFDDGTTRDYPPGHVCYLPNEAEIAAKCAAIIDGLDEEARQKRRNEKRIAAEFPALTVDHYRGRIYFTPI